MEELYVKPEHRKRGYAKRLIEEFARITVGMGGERMDWVAYADNAKALRFYEGIGAARKGGWGAWRVEGQALGKLLDEEEVEAQEDAVGG